MKNCISCHQAKTIEVFGHCQDCIDEKMIAKASEVVKTKEAKKEADKYWSMLNCPKCKLHNWGREMDKNGNQGEIYCMNCEDPKPIKEHN